MVIKKTKIFSFINKVYHIKDEIGILSRKNSKRVKTKTKNIGKILLTGMLMREKSINKEKIPKAIFKTEKMYQRCMDSVMG